MPAVDQAGPGQSQELNPVCMAETQLLERLRGAFSGVQQQKAGTGSEWSLDLNLGILV